MVKIDRIDQKRQCWRQGHWLTDKKGHYYYGGWVWKRFGPCTIEVRRAKNVDM